MPPGVGAGYSMPNAVQTACSGTGTAGAATDQPTSEPTVTSKAPTASAALRQNSADMDKVIKQIVALGIKREDLIKPTKAELEAIGAKYIATVEPTAKATLDQLRAAGWKIAIVSGGFTQAILPLAAYLGIDRVEAVILRFNADGSYAGFDESCPTCRSRGKNVVARRLRAEHQATQVIMVGDGASDLEVKGDADKVIGFGRYAVRAKVKAGADAFITSLTELPSVV